MSLVRYSFASRGDYPDVSSLSWPRLAVPGALGDAVAPQPFRRADTSCTRETSKLVVAGSATRRPSVSAIETSTKYLPLTTWSSGSKPATRSASKVLVVA